MHLISEDFEKRMKARLRILFEDPTSLGGKILNYFLISLIIISIILFTIETTEFGRHYKNYFYFFDFFVISIFTVEYLIRLYLARKKGKFIFSPLAIIDLLVILSFYLAHTDLVAFRALRIFKILQLLKFFRYSESSLEFFKTFKNYKNEFKIFGIMLTSALLLSSTGLYYLERNSNPDIQSLPDSLWWAAVTLSTVGYGDTVPVTAGGKILAAIMMFLGLGLIAMFTAIITKMFIDNFFGKNQKSCPQCRFPMHDYNAKFCKNCGGSLE